MRGAREADLRQMCARLRPEDRRELRYFSGLSANRALDRALANSKKAYAIDDSGRILGLFGVTTVPRDSAATVYGAPWMVCSQELVTLHTARFLREYPQWLAEISKGYKVLENYALAANETHLRWITWAGFEFVELIRDYGPFHQPFWRFQMRVDTKESTRWRF